MELGNASSFQDLNQKHFIAYFKDDQLVFRNILRVLIMTSIKGKNLVNFLDN
jgi:hypothetical protein